MNSVELLHELQSAVERVDGHRMAPELVPFAESTIQDKSFTIIPRGYNVKATSTCLCFTETYQVQVWRLGASGSISQSELRAKIQPDRDAVLRSLMGLSFVDSTLSGGYEDSPKGDFVKMIINVGVSYDAPRS